MHSKLLSWIVLFSALAGFFVPAFAQGVVPPPTSVAQIKAARVVGAVTILDRVTRVVVANVTNDMTVPVGALVRTAASSSVVLVFSNGATVSLGADSELDIEQFTQDPFSVPFSPSRDPEEPSRSTTRIKLNQGELVGKVVKLKRDQGSTFSVSTPVGAAGIRGTTFRLVYRPTGTGQAFFQFTTLEGNVEVVLGSGTVAAAPVSITDQQEVVISDLSVTVTPSGEVQVSSPTLGGVIATLAPAAASASSQQIVQSGAQAIAEAVATVVFTPPAPGTGGGGNQEQSNQTDQNQPTDQPPTNPTGGTTTPRLPEESNPNPPQSPPGGD